MSHRILVVEPDGSIRSLLAAVLRRQRYDAVFAESPRDVARAMRSGRFCLAIVDCLPREAALIDIIATDPELPIAVTATLPKQLGKLPGRVVQVLHKPYDIAAIDALAHAHCARSDDHAAL